MTVVTSPRSAPALRKNLRVRAFAKINTGLKIVGKRPDGYHEIRTIYQTIALHDGLEISLTKAGKGIEVECTNPAVPAGPGNLVYRACELWAGARRWKGGVRVHLEKVIPMGSGLGGASTDAAATLLGLERLTGDRLDFAARHKLAAALGSDVPLFLLGGRVLGCGRGEEVYPLRDLPPCACLVIFPGFSVSTAEAYREAGAAVAAVSDRRRRSEIDATVPAVGDRRYNAGLRLTQKGSTAYIGSFGAWPHLPLMSWGPAENDFEKVVFARWPKLASLKRQLIRAGAEVASLTGSGSAIFALFSSVRQMALASKLIPNGWLSFQTRTLAQPSYHRKLFLD